MSIKPKLIHNHDKFIERLDSDLAKPKPEGPLALDLFAGAGGLALGFEVAGFRTIGYEMEPEFCKTYNQNLDGPCHELNINTHTQFPAASVVFGGPPCQPFSVGGGQRGLDDTRNGLPAFVSAIEKLQPDIWVFENVRGILYRNREYFDETIDYLSSLDYQVEWRLLKAVDYGVPQNRERVFVVGHKGGFEWPDQEQTKFSAGAALGPMAHSIPKDAKFLSASMDAYIARYEKASKCKVPRDLHLDKPARTLTTRNLAGATADMQRIRLSDGRRRRITVREAARLQSFPDWFNFSGSVSSQFVQLGNAVPPLMALAVGKAVMSYVIELSSSKRNETMDQFQLAMSGD